MSISFLQSSGTYHEHKCLYISEKNNDCDKVELTEKSASEYLLTIVVNSKQDLRLHQQYKQQAIFLCIICGE